MGHLHDRAHVHPEVGHDHGHPGPLVPDDAGQEPVDEWEVGVVDIVEVGLQGLEEVVQTVVDAADVVGVADVLVLETVAAAGTAC